MQEKKNQPSLVVYEILLDLFNKFKGRKNIPLKEIFEKIKISKNNTITWKKVKKILEDEEIYSQKPSFHYNEKVVNLDWRKLRNLILNLEIYNKTDEFIHKKDRDPFKIT